jgi:hypothetical protein
MAVFEDIVSCRLVDIGRHSTEAYFVHHQVCYEGNKFLWNIGQYLADFTARYPKRRPSSCSSSVWWTEISLRNLNALSWSGIFECQRVCFLVKTTITSEKTCPYLLWDKTQLSRELLDKCNWKNINRIHFELKSTKKKKYCYWYLYTSDWIRNVLTVCLWKENEKGILNSSSYLI